MWTSPGRKCIFVCKATDLADESAKHQQTNLKLAGHRPLRTGAGYLCLRNRFGIFTFFTEHLLSNLELWHLKTFSHFMWQHSRRQTLALTFLFYDFFFYLHMTNQVIYEGRMLKQKERENYLVNSLKTIFTKYKALQRNKFFLNFFTFSHARIKLL